jgi:regulator of ribonuclease activity A
MYLFRECCDNLPLNIDAKSVTTACFLETQMNIKTSDLCDASEEVMACELPLRSFGSRESFSGTIRTVQCFEDVDLIRQAINQPGHDHVLVIDGGGSERRALFGDVMAEIAVRNGWRGLIINGAIRDANEIGNMAIGIKALGTAPRRGERTGAGQRDIPVTFGGITFTPGSRLVADTDGVVVLPPNLKETDISIADVAAQAAAYAVLSGN